MKHNPISRRDVLELGALGGTAFLIGCEPKPSSKVQATPDVTDRPDASVDAAADVTVEETPQCIETDDDILGPYFKAGAPETSDLLEAGMVGTILTLSGRLQNERCEPIENALIDFWQADDRGADSAVYDLVGYKLRGKVRSGAGGLYSLRTIIPGRYLNGAQFRPAHIHVRTSAFGHQELITQLYFKGDPFNESDPWFQASLALTLEEVGEERRAVFDLVVARNG